MKDPLANMPHSLVHCVNVCPSLLLVSCCVFSLQQDKEPLVNLLDDTEDWLYGEGEDETKTVYQERLAQMKVCGGVHWSGGRSKRATQQVGWG